MNINLSIPQWFVAIFNLGLAVFSVLSEVWPAALPWSALPTGMGWAIAIISATMGAVLLSVSEERTERDKLAEKFDRAFNKTGALGRVLAARVSTAVPVHERHFYTLWSSQVRTAQHTVDVCHLGPTPPRSRHGESEANYFENLGTLIRSTHAHVRRVERLSPAKNAWIRKLMKDFEGVENFSLVVYRDESDEELLRALSVSRIDDSYAWLVAVAEHESTTGYRDLLITGEKAVALMSEYFSTRLWASKYSTKIMDHGQPIAGWDRIFES